MSLRVAFDIDGVLADFGAAYREVELRLFGPGEPAAAAAARHKDEREPVLAMASSVRRHVKRQHRRRAAVWEAIRTTPDFWVGLKPAVPDAVQRLHTLALDHRWDVFFMTQRPPTQGDTVQRQTQRWLHDHGFDMPSVLVLNGSRGTVSASLSIDYYVDDDATNCVDVAAGSRARSILVVGDEDATTLGSAQRLGIATARNVAIALDFLGTASAARPRPHMLRQLARLVRWT